MVNFREFVTSSGLRVLGGKNSENNDELVWSAAPTDILLHTCAPGSPFVNVGSGACKKDIREAAVFCAKFSQDWRDSKRDVVVNVFFRKDMTKDRRAKEGSWFVSKQDRLRVKAVDILKFEKGLRGGDV
ncbi:MAG: NFACT RNA binding domain-containing protein [Bacteroidales bacterium]|nr:NFACT RNA binding domain-containing protein [Bacteroidales bacterium]